MGYLAAREWVSSQRPSRDQNALRQIAGQRHYGAGFNRQVTELQVRAALLNGFTALGILQTHHVGEVRLG